MATQPEMLIGDFAVIVEWAKSVFLTHCMLYYIKSANKENYNITGVWMKYIWRWMNDISGFEYTSTHNNEKRIDKLFYCFNGRDVTGPYICE